VQGRVDGGPLRRQEGDRVHRRFSVRPA
jgi:hypothetical protein